MKDKIFNILQRIGRSFMMPIAILPIAGLLLGVGVVFTNPATIDKYRLMSILSEGSLLYSLLIIMSKVGSAVASSMPLIFAVGVAIGMSHKEKETAALASVVAFIAMHTAINATLVVTGKILPDGNLVETVLAGTITSIYGIQTLQMGVFGGIIVGLGVAALHNRFYKIELPSALSFFGGTRFIPIVSTVAYMFVGILACFVWPTIQRMIYDFGAFLVNTGYVGTFIIGIIKRGLIPFGLHHAFYVPLWQTGLGGTMEIAGQIVEGSQNIFFAELANIGNINHFSQGVSRYFSGEFIFMMFGLPGTALAMYHCAKPQNRHKIGKMLLVAALTAMATGITEPIEFAFMFVAPALYVIHVILGGLAYTVAHVLNIGVGLTFSGGFLDFFIYGILQGNDKTSWMKVIPAGIAYFFIYYLIFRILIVKFNYKTPGREDGQSGESNEIIHGKSPEACIKSKIKDNTTVNNKAKTTATNPKDTLSADILRGLGDQVNITTIDCCATRLRCIVKNPELVDDTTLKATGATGVIQKGENVQVVYGPNVTIIKANLDDYLENLSSVGDENHATEDTHNPQIVLASASPRRKELLALIGISDFEVHPAVGEEMSDDSLPIADRVVDIAYHKCLEVAEKYTPDTVIVSADTVVAIDGEILGKPHTTDEAIAMLESLSGRAHTVYTGVIVKRGSIELKKCKQTQVHMRKITNDEIQAYVATGEPMDKAGAYGIQGKGGTFVESIDGDYSNVVGLPVCMLSQMLAEVGVSVI